MANKEEIKSYLEFFRCQNKIERSSLINLLRRLKKKELDVVVRGSSIFRGEKYNDIDLLISGDKRKYDELFSNIHDQFACISSSFDENKPRVYFNGISSDILSPYDEVIIEGRVRIGLEYKINPKEKETHLTIFDAAYTSENIWNQRTPQIRLVKGRPITFKDKVLSYFGLC